MLYHLLDGINKIAKFETAEAHCDIPCGIYDPAPALIAALSVIRLMDIMQENAEKPAGLERDAAIARCVAMKELEAAKVKDEIRVIWGDYFKAPQIEKHPNIHGLVHEIMVTAGKCKQTTARENGEKLLELVNDFAKIFWETKGIETEMKTSPYAPNLDVVRPA